MENYDLIVARHSVRQYLPKPIEADKRALIEEEIKNLNKESGLRMQAIYDEPKCFDSFMAIMGSLRTSHPISRSLGRKARTLIAWRVIMARNSFCSSKASVSTRAGSL